MSNTKMAVAGDIVRYVGGPCYDLTRDRLYPITAITACGRGANFKDDKGNGRCFWDTEKYEIVGKVNPPEPKLKDIQGNDVAVGDTIAYAFAGAMSRHLALFEVVSIQAQVAMCRAKSDGAVINLGMLYERAIKVKE